MSDQKGKAGRPSSYTTEIGLEICARISSGQSLRQVCRDEGMPATSTVMLWALNIPEFTEQYAKARGMLLEHWAEDIIDISDDGKNDWIAANDPENPGYRANGEHINRSRLRVDTRKWLLSKLAAKKYGDRVTTELTGRDGGPIETVDLSETEIARRIAFALQQGANAQEKAH